MGRGEAMGGGIGARREDWPTRDNATDRSDLCVVGRGGLLLGWFGGCRLPYLLSALLYNRMTSHFTPGPRCTWSPA